MFCFYYKLNKKVIFIPPIIIIPLENEKYQSYIQRILKSRENKKDTTNYQEHHHIVPKCMNGTNEKENLIWLYAQEHFYAHKLLAEENPTNKGLWFGFWNMCQCERDGRENIKITADEYATIREKVSKMISESKKGVPLSENHRQSLIGLGGFAVRNLTTGKEYASAGYASSETGIKADAILKCCRGALSRAGCDAETQVPYIWEFVDERERPEKREEHIIHIRRKVICIETQEVFNSIKEAKRKTGVATTTILRDCKHTSSRQNKNRKHFEFYVDNKETTT